MKSVMKKFAIGLLILIAAAVEVRAQGPEMPVPQKEHQWLAQFVGDWDTEFEIVMDPAQPPMKSKGVDKVRPLGGFWVIAEGECEMMGDRYSSVLTLGYNPKLKKYVGTWVDSASGQLWTYQGSVDETGKILTLDTEGPCPMQDGRITKFQEVTEFKNKDHRVFTASFLAPDGKWQKMMTINSRRKK